MRAALNIVWAKAAVLHYVRVDSVSECAEKSIGRDFHPRCAGAGIAYEDDIRGSKIGLEKVPSNTYAEASLRVRQKNGWLITGVLEIVSRDIHSRYIAT